MSAAAPRRGTPFGTFGKIVREATRLDPAGVHLRWGLRCSVGAAIPLLVREERHYHNGVLLAPTPVPLPSGTPDLPAPAPGGGVQT